MNQPQPYQRPELTPAELAEITRTAALLIQSRNTARTLATLMGLMRENALLARECNEHRAARGFELLPIHDLPKQ